MCAHLALPPYQAYPGGTGMGYLDFYWNSAGEAGHGPTSAGPGEAVGAGQSPEAGGKRQTAGKAFRLRAGADPRGTCGPSSAALLNDLEKSFLSLCLGFLMCERGRARCRGQGGRVTLGKSHHLSMGTVIPFPNPQQSLQEFRHCQVCAAGWRAV